MKKSMYLILVMVVSLLAKPIQFNGKVIALGFNTGINLCSVKLLPLSPTAMADSTFTSNGGIFTFLDVRPGVYLLQLKNSEYINDSVEICVEESVERDFYLMRKSHTVISTLPDTLKKINSPFFILDTIDINHEVVIEPGVSIYCAKRSLLFFKNKVTAYGTKEDYITFSGNYNSSDLNIISPKSEFLYCRFTKFKSIDSRPPQDTSILNTVLLADCTSDSIGSLYFTNNNVYIHKSTFHSTGYIYTSTDTIVLNECFFNTSCQTTIETNYSGKICANTFLAGVQIYLSYSSSDSIFNNIFINSQITRDGDKPIFVAYNNLYNSYADLPGVGTPLMNNDFGEPCDFYLNIFSDPLIEDSMTGRIALNSHCINAGFRGLTIGAWQPGDTKINLTNKSDIRKQLHLTKQSIYMSDSKVGIVSNQSSSSANRGVFLVNGRSVSIKKNILNQQNKQSKIRTNGYYITNIINK